MPVTLSQVRKLLAADEPNYPAAARLGPQVLPILEHLVSGQDTDMAAKAASLAGMIDHDRATVVLERASRSPSATVRLAAAGAMRTLQRPAVSGLLLRLLGDADKGVRRFAIKAAATRRNPALVARMRSLAQNDPVDTNKALAKRAVANSGTAVG